jgi:multiple sugar transport system substrate-binding protein
MRRITVTGTALAAGLAALLVAAGCTSTGGGASPDATGAISPGAAHAKTTITVWTFNTLAPEVKAYQEALNRLHSKYSWLTVRFVSGKDDAALAKAVAANKTPDVYVATAPDNVGKFCHNGTVLDLGPFLRSAKIDTAAIFPKAVRAYTTYQGKQCALPLLTDAYGLYYNKKLFAAAGIASPPKTLSELAADAKKLTTRNPDGSIRTFGFVPRSDGAGGDNVNMYQGVQTNSVYYDPAGKSTFASDPNWAAMLRWDKSLLDWYGGAQVQRFVSATNPHTDDASAPFITGQEAMMFDGEWHVGELADNAKNLDYGVAPMPVLDGQQSRYGVGYSAGTVVYVPRGTKHPEEAAFAAERLTTDTAFLDQLADAMSNIPTTFDSLKKWDLASDPHWKSLIDIFANPGSYTKQQTPVGAEDSDDWGKFIQDYEQGKVPDLDKGLTDFSAKVNSLAQQASQ